MTDVQCSLEPTHLLQLPSALQGQPASEAATIGAHSSQSLVPASTQPALHAAPESQRLHAQMKVLERRLAAEERQRQAAEWRLAAAEERRQAPEQRLAAAKQRARATEQRQQALEQRLGA